MEQLTVLYARVSSDGQSVEMQLLSAESLIRDIPKSELVYLIDNGVSATKVKMRNRPKLNELMKLIRTGKVSKLIVYDRDRLARNFYEYLAIAQLIIEMDVQVIFTGTNVRPFDTSLVMEAVGAMFAQFEAEAIKRRRNDALKQFPVNLLGYIRQKNNDGSVTYKVNETVAEYIYDFFEETTQLSDPDSFIDLLEEYHKKLNRNVLRLLTILTTPFYAGYWDRNGVLYPLKDVPSIVPLEIYKAVQEKLANFRAIVLKISTPIEETLAPSPKCGLCGETMHFRYSKLHQTKKYQCPKHRNNVINGEKLQTDVESLILRLTKRLDYEAFRTECSFFLQTQQRNTNARIHALEQQLARFAVEITRRFAARVGETELNSLVEKQKELHAERDSLMARIQGIEVVQAQISELTRNIMNLFTDSVGNSREHMMQLSRLLLKSIHIFPGKTEIEVNCVQYLATKGDENHVS